MATSTQKILLTIIIMQIVFGTIIYEMKTNKDIYNNNLKYEAENKEEIFKEITDTENLISVQTNTQLQENTAGDSLLWSKNIFKLLKNAGEILGIIPLQYEDPVEQAMSYTFTITRWILWVICALEIFLVLKNQKAT